MPCAERCQALTSSRPSLPVALRRAPARRRDDALTDLPCPHPAGIITREQLEMIYSIDQQPPMSQVAIFHQKGTVMVETFVDILKGINKVGFFNLPLHPRAARPPPLAQTAGSMARLIGLDELRLSPL